MNRALVVSLTATMLLGIHALPRAQGQGNARAATEPVEVVQLRPHFYMIGGAGGNIAVQTGHQRHPVVDTGTAEAARRALAAIRKATTEPIAHHQHEPRSRPRRWQPGDRESGTPDLRGNPGLETAIFAHANVLLRMRRRPARSRRFLPTLAHRYLRSGAQDLYFNQEGVQIITVPAGHSDAASIVFFRGSDGRGCELLDATRFPVIDLAKGGSSRARSRA